MAKITGKIINVCLTQKIPSKTPGREPFSKREFVMAVQSYDRDTGEPTIDEDNTPVFTLTGERCSQADGLVPGQMVTVSYGIRGRKYRDSEGKEKIMTDINVISVTPMRGQPSVPAPQMTAPDPAPARNAEPDNDGLPF